MTGEKDYIDVTPIEAGGKGSAGRTETVFQETEWAQILDNPGNLTKEGIMKKIELWKRSANKHTELKYKTMLARCKNVAPSGEVENKRFIGNKEVTEKLTIFSRKPDGSPNWVGKLGGG